MNSALKAIFYAHMASAAEGNAIQPIPDGFVSGGPCPHCKHIVSPNPQGFTFAAPDDESALCALAAAVSSPNAGIVVCSHCAKPLYFEKPGEYQPMARKLVRQLPRVTQKFIKREQELIALLRRTIN